MSGAKAFEQGWKLRPNRAMETIGRPRRLGRPWKVQSRRRDRPMNEGMDRPSRHSSPPSQVPPTVLPSQPGHLVRPVLAAWTGVLIILVVAASRTIPPVVLAFLLPYLALVAWHLLARQGRSETDRTPIPEDSAFMPRPDIDLEEATSAPSASYVAVAESSEVPETSPAPGTVQRPSTAAPVRTRRRIKPKAVPEPCPASWVQVGPGRFVRGEEPQPSPDALVEGEPMTQAPDTPPDAADDDPNHSRPPDDAATEGLVVGAPAAPTVVPVTAPGASELGDATVHSADDQDHLLIREAGLTGSASMPGSSCSSESRSGVTNATPGSHWID